MLKLENDKLTQRGIKSVHLKQIYLNALKSGTTSRRQLKKELHLSAPSVCALVDEMIGCGLLAETGTAEASGRGRPCTKLQVVPGVDVIPVVSLCEDGFEAFLFDICANQLEHQHLYVEFPPSQAEGSYCCLEPSQWIAPILEWVDAIKKTYRPLALLLSLCGSIHNGFFTSSVLHIKVQQEFLTLLKEKTGLEVFTGNNASFFAYEEKQFQPDSSDFIFIVIENGVGAGIIRDGEIFGDGEFRAGEIGHISIDYQGRSCICGNRGCLEQYVSIPAISADFGSSFDDICNAYQNGDPAVAKLIDEKASQLAIGINNILCMHPTERIILGGQIKSLGPAFLSCLQEKVSTSGMRKLMDRITLEYSRSESYGDIHGALWNYFDHVMRIDDLMK